MVGSRRRLPRDADLRGNAARSGPRDRGTGRDSGRVHDDRGRPGLPRRGRPASQPDPAEVLKMVMALPSRKTEITEHLRVREIDVTPSNIVEWVRPEPVSELEAECMTLLQPGDYEIYVEKLANYLDEAREIFLRSGVTSML